MLPQAAEHRAGRSPPRVLLFLGDGCWLAAARTRGLCAWASWACTPAPRPSVRFLVNPAGDTGLLCTIVGQTHFSSSLAGRLLEPPAGPVRGFGPRDWCAHVAGFQTQGAQHKGQGTGLPSRPGQTGRAKRGLGGDRGASSWRLSCPSPHRHFWATRLQPGQEDGPSEAGV